MPEDFYDLFLSHSKRDSHLVETLLDQLQALGYRVWFDKSEIKGGDLWFTNISNGVRNSGFVLFVGSINSYCSENCRDELNIARQENRRIITLLTDSTSKPSYLAFLGQTHQIKHAKNGNHLHELKEIVPPRLGQGSAIPTATAAPRVDFAAVDRIAERLPRSVDRFVQKEKVETVFKVQFTPPKLGDLSAPPGGPLVVLAHGPEAEAPEKLCFVLSDQFLKVILDLVAGSRRRFSKPESHDLMCPEDDFKQPKELAAKWQKRLANALCIRTAPRIPDIIAKLECSPACHVFRFSYRATSGDRELKNLLTAWLDFWAAPAWKMSPDCRCVVFLSIIYPLKKDRTKLVEKLAKIAAPRFPKGRFVPLEPCTSVSKHDALQWVKEPSVQKELAQLRLSPDQVEKFISSAYGALERLPMQTILEKFQGFLSAPSTHT